MNQFTSPLLAEPIDPAAILAKLTAKFDRVVQEDAFERRERLAALQHKFEQGESKGGG